MAIPASIERFVRESGVSFTPIHHRVAFTAQEEAAATHVPGMEWAKTVVCFADGKPILAVLPAHYRLDLYALRTHARRARRPARRRARVLGPLP